MTVSPEMKYNRIWIFRQVDGREDKTDSSSDRKMDREAKKNIEGLKALGNGLGWGKTLTDTI
jgi:hypothetical protein